MNPQVMVLGTFHFHQEGIQFLDIQSVKRQNEIKDVVDRIAKFKPNKIAVEYKAQLQNELDNKYSDYLLNKQLDAQDINNINEISMLGFQIAALCGISQLNAIDYRNQWLQEKVLDYAKHNSPLIAEEIETRMNKYIQMELQQINKPIHEILHYLNSPESIQRQHSDTFLIYNQIGNSDDYAGTEFVSSWYDRNLKIFSNLQRLAEKDDRVLVIYGAGHCVILNQLVSEYYAMDFISPLDYLK